MSPPVGYPIITLTVDNLKHSVRLALADHLLSLDTLVQQELDRACSEEAVRRTIKTLVDIEVTRAFEEELQRFFRYGVGREAIRQAVLAKLQPAPDVVVPTSDTLRN